MSVEDKPPFSEHTGNGITTVFAYQFQILDQGDLAVYVDSVLKVLGADYSISGVGSPSGGQVTFTAAPAVDADVLLFRSMVLERDTDYQTNGDLREVVLDRDFDRLWMVVQGQQTDIRCTLRLPFPEVVDPLPSKSSRAGGLLGFDSTGLPAIYPGAQEILDSAERAEAAADTAEAAAAVAVQAKDDAIAAAGAIGPIRFYGTYALALADVTNIPVNGLIEIARDETLSDARTRYFKRVGDVLEFAVNLDQLRIDLAATGGSARVGFDGGTVQDVLDKAKTLQNYSALRAYTGRATAITITTPGIAGAFDRDDSDVTSADDKWSLIVDASGRRWKRRDADTMPITPDLFGAKNDNTAVADVPVQDAIDFCNSTNPARPLLATGKYKITSQLLIDRMVDTTNGEFVIYGNGDEGTGFYISGVADGFKLFGSRLPYGPPVESYPTTPVTEFVTLRGVSVVNTTVHNNVYIFDNKYLRVTLEQGFKGRKVRVFEGAPYLQSIRSIGSKFRDHTEFLIDVQDGYDVHFDYTQIEKSGKGFRFNGVLRGGSFDKGLFQANVGPYLTFAGAVSVSVKNTYFEQNTNPDLIFGISSGSYNGVTLSDNFHFLSATQAVEPSFYPVVLGAASKVSLFSNVSSGNLFDNTQVLPFSITEGGNAAEKNVFAVPVMSGEIGASGATQATANPIIKRINYITSGASNSGIILPKISKIVGGDIFVYNQTANNILVYPNTGERLLGLAYNAPATITPGTSIRFVSLETDTWIIS